MLALLLAACGGATVEEAGGGDQGGEAASAGASEGAATAECGEFNIAINPWVGYEANAAVIAHVAETELGCDVTKKD
ncbi:MAG TPA: hypothetical protein VK891_00775, partial [Euzebyales bacterium]|nr:hypothetical protein [Euzebyales bacterium]